MTKVQMFNKFPEYNYTPSKNKETIMRMVIDSFKNNHPNDELCNIVKDSYNLINNPSYYLKVSNMELVDYLCNSSSMDTLIRYIDKFCIQDDNFVSHQGLTAMVANALY